LRHKIVIWNIFHHYYQSSRGNNQSAHAMMALGDYCTREGAERLKEQIEAYWADRGHQVRVNLVQGGFLASMRSARTDIRSNLTNGVPAGGAEDFA